MDDRIQILLVDDRAENLLALEAILEPLGQQLTRANSGPEALRKVLETIPVGQLTAPRCLCISSGVMPLA